jgi:hypothetical protein
VRKIAAVFLFAVLGLTGPTSARAQNQSYDAARFASQRHNARRSHKAAREQKQALRKAIRKAGKPKTPQTRTSQTLN